ncbi:MAG TPA: glycosyltransferase family 2 protein, partial [Gemmatimonadaceae bacterium]|nr:glycosyltransferase family 2 protein [Gemmatimonadaceae bacterium]
MPRPLVTILSPVYNQERYVAQCIESALAQTYTEWEQIFVDDGSTDGTRDVIARYRDPRIQVIALPHRGLGALAESYNAALAVARGSLVGILEGDDAWPADKLELQVPTFDDPATFLSWGRGALIDA